MAAKEKTKKPVFAPASEKQKLLLTDKTTDVILVGGGEHCASV